MPKLTLKITGSVPLGGKRPGEQFLVDCNEEGAPTDIYWRRRLKDEDVHKCGAVAVIASPVVSTVVSPVVSAVDPATSQPSDPSASPAPPVAPAPVRSRKA